MFEWKGLQKTCVTNESGLHAQMIHIILSYLRIRRVVFTLISHTFCIDLTCDPDSETCNAQQSSVSSQLQTGRCRRFPIQSDGQNSCVELEVGQEY